jgi:hypothetical protein
MTQDEIRKLLGGYATNALTADERRILFEAALEDQELFNALQNEDALRELLDDTELRDQVRRALAAPGVPKTKFSWRRWAWGVALPAVVAVIVILVMYRPKAPEPIPQPIQTARVEPPKVAAAPEVAPPPQAKTQSTPVRRLERAAPAIAPSPAAKKQSTPVEALARATPAMPAAPAPAALDQAQRAEAPAAASFRAGAVRPVIPDAVRQQFSAGFAANASLYQGPLVRYSLIRSGSDVNTVRVEVSTGIAGYLALYRVDAAGNLPRVFPTNDVAVQVLPNVTMQIPMEPVRVEAGERLRLVVVPGTAPGVIGALGGAANDATPQAPSVPLVVDIPLSP